MKFLLDTNTVIPAEPTSLQDVEPGSYIVAELLRILAEGKHQVFLHPASLEELRKDPNHVRRQIRDLLLRKYPKLHGPPPPSARLVSVLGTPPPDSHDAIDHELLAAVESDAVDVLVTDDIGIHRKADRLGVGERVATPKEAVAFVRSLFPVTPVPPPAVLYMSAYQLDEADPIFESFRRDYPEFDKWLRKCKRDHRDTWVVKTQHGVYEGITIIKPGDTGEYGLTGRVLKICSFKIAEESRGSQLGELLLKPVFDYAFANDYDCLYLEVFPKYKELIIFLQAFGFTQLPQESSKGEYVMMKALMPPEGVECPYSPLDFHIKFGPYHFLHSGVSALIVPILPDYHRLLFPEAEPQRELFPGQHAFGNSIRKAYLCRSSIRKIKPGDLLFFYLSRTGRALTCLGVVEQTLVSSDPASIARFAGKRTVYSYAQIEQMCRGPILAILFRQSRVLKDPIKWEELAERQVLKGPPRSIVRISQEALTWLLSRMQPSH